MKLPLGIVATDLADGQPILFQRGDTGTAVRASSSVPAVFQPVKIGEREYVDGGLVAPVPVRYAKQMGAEFVIAVDISSPPDGAATGDAMRMLLQTFSIMGRSINNFELKEADIVLRPKLTGISSADFARANARSRPGGRWGWRCWARSSRRWRRRGGERFDRPHAGGVISSAGAPSPGRRLGPSVEHDAPWATTAAQCLRSRSKKVVNSVGVIV